MKLYTSPTSPFGRKCHVLALEAGLGDMLRVENVDLASPPVNFLSRNPLGKIPYMETENGEILFDSAVICDYIDSLHDKTPFIPREGRSRWQTLRLQALADGAGDAAVLAYLENKRQDHLRSDAWVEKQMAKMNRAIDMMEVQAGDFHGRNDLGVIAVAAILGWIELRVTGKDWMEDRPKLTAWMKDFRKRTSMVETAAEEGL